MLFFAGLLLGIIVGVVGTICFFVFEMNRHFGR